MALETPSGTEPGMTTLVAGAIDDVQELLKQQLALFKHEVRDDLQKAKEAGASLAMGLGMILVGGIFLAAMLVFLLQEGMPTLPLWACFAIVGFCITAVGGVLLYLGKKQLDSFHLMPEQSVKSLKENVRWMQNPQ